MNAFSHGGALKFVSLYEEVFQKCAHCEEPDGVIGDIHILDGVSFRQQFFGVGGDRCAPRMNPEVHNTAIYTTVLYVATVRHVRQLVLCRVDEIIYDRRCDLPSRRSC